MVSIDLDSLDLDVDEPMSLKDLKKAEKKQAKALSEPPAASQDHAPSKPNDAKAAALQALDGLDFDDADDDAPKFSKKELLKQQKKGLGNNAVDAKDSKIQRALELDAADEARQQASAAADLDTPALSKKELKELQKKQEKEAAKAEAKAAKKASKNSAVQSFDEESVLTVDDNVDSSVTLGANVDSDDEIPFDPNRLTLEEKIRKERPPPRIRVMESAQPGYTSLRLEGVGITFRDQQVLKDVTWGVTTGDRIGLVGANGAGKTTQLRIMAGELEPTTGDVVKSSQDLRVSMLRQEFVDELVQTRTLKEEFMSVFVEENAILQSLRAAEVELESLGPENADRMQDILDEMQQLQNKAENKGVYALESKCKKIMDLMGFTDDEGEDLVASFSGGWKMRIGLGKVLLQDPNVLLLDEPTNHLDLESVEWLEAFLRQQNIPMIIVSHDREFLDQVCTKIVDAEGGVCTEYDGNYSRFLSLKKARTDAWHAAYNAQEKKIKEERAWIAKFKVKQPQAVKQRIAKIEKLMASEDYVQKPPFLGKPFKFRFPDAPRLSPEVASIKNLSHSYRNGETENKLLVDADLDIGKGDRIAVVGPNGAGKSTLLRLMLGREKPDLGVAELVGQNVVPQYFEQNQADALDLDKTVIETVQAASVDQSYNELRALLGQFLFKGDAVEKKVRYLSGGEKARLSLCCMMLRPANLLILDEPTNHLDIPAKEMLEEALQHFSGAVCVISHDRYFISRVATTIVAIEEKKLVRYMGDYKFYMDKMNKIKDKVEARYIKGVEQRIESAPVIDLESMSKPKANFGGAKTANLVTRKDKGVKNAKRNQVS